LDITAHRNAFGRQIDSFETDIAIPAVGSKPFHAVFIRAPLFSDLGSDVEILAQVDSKRIVAVRQGNLLATSFHPELSDDTRMHEYFLKF
jgi:5'-phosphate synthase pdxT subunit